MSVPQNIRQELVRLCSKEGTRKAEFSRKMPTKWHPSEARDPSTGESYTPRAAWDRVHAELVSGCVLQTVTLDKPPGKTGYTFHFVDGAGKRIYVKLQLLGGYVLGRSFHEG